MFDPVNRIFGAATEPCWEDPQRFRWLLLTSDSAAPHSRSDLCYPTREAALAQARALAAVLNAALGHDVSARRAHRRKTKGSGCATGERRSRSRAGHGRERTP